MHAMLSLTMLVVLFELKAKIINSSPLLPVHPPIQLDGQVSG